MHNNQHNKMGVSFIEILIVLLLLSLFASFVIPTFITKQQHDIKKKFVGEFNTLVQESLSQAIMTGKIHQIFFDLDDHKIIIRVQDLSIQGEGKHKQFRQNKDGSSTAISIPENFVIRNFFIQGEDEVKSGKLENAWFYIMPDGTSQTVIINIENQNTDAKQATQFALTINPFYSQVQEYDKFQQP